MTTTPVEILPHDLAVMAALETIGRPVGFAAAPPGALEGVRSRDGEDYIVLYPISGLRDGSLADDNDVELVYQTTIVGQAPEGVRWLIDQIESALAGVTIAGRSVLKVSADDIGAVRPDEDVQPPVFIATPVWRIGTTPA